MNLRKNSGRRVVSIWRLCRETNTDALANSMPSFLKTQTYTSLLHSFVCKYVSIAGNESVCGHLASSESFAWNMTSAPTHHYQ